LTEILPSRLLHLCPPLLRVCDFEAGKEQPDTFLSILLPGGRAMAIMWKPGTTSLILASTEKLFIRARRREWYIQAAIERVIISYVFRSIFDTVLDSSYIRFFVALRSGHGRYLAGLEPRGRYHAHGGREEHVIHVTRVGRARGDHHRGGAVDIITPGHGAAVLVVRGVVRGMGPPAAARRGRYRVGDARVRGDGRFQSFINWLVMMRRLDRVVVDECHIIMNPQKDFRP
jgi:hypothetical protein